MSINIIYISFRSIIQIRKKNLKTRFNAFGSIRNYKHKKLHTHTTNTHKCNQEVLYIYNINIYIQFKKIQIKDIHLDILHTYTHSYPIKNQASIPIKKFQFHQQKKSKSNQCWTGDVTYITLNLTAYIYFSVLKLSVFSIWIYSIPS